MKRKILLALSLIFACVLFAPPTAALGENFKMYYIVCIIKETDSTGAYDISKATYIGSAETVGTLCDNPDCGSTGIHYVSGDFIKQMMESPTAMVKNGDYELLGWSGNTDIENTSAIRHDYPAYTPILERDAARRGPNNFAYIVIKKGTATKKYSLSYDANGGSGAPSSSSILLIKNTSEATFTIPNTVPTREGYEFLGWSFNPNWVIGTQLFAPGSTVTIDRNMTLYASWCQHIWMKTQSQPATCTEKGMDSYICNSCGKKRTDWIPALEHSYTVLVNHLDPTCTTTGFTVMKCERCDATQGTTIPALEHQFRATTYRYEDDGKTCVAERTCTRAGCTTTETFRDSNPGSSSTPAECLRPGHITYYHYFHGCDWAEPQVSPQMPLAPLGHQWGETAYTWSEDNSSCTASHTCTRADCGKITLVVGSESETVATSYRVVSNPTCAALGVGEYSAEFQNAGFARTAKNVDIPTIPHRWGSWTDNGSGSHSISCLDCTAVKTSHPEAQGYDAACTLPACQKYAVTFETGGGTDVPAKTDLGWFDKVLDGITEPHRDGGWAFDGWYAGSDALDSETTISELAGKQSGTALVVIARWKDVQPPTGYVTVNGGRTYSGFFQPEQITFRTFVPQLNVSVSASDNGGSVTVGVLAAPSAMTQEALTAETGFVPPENFHADADGNYILYVRLTDAAGNTAYLSTQGMVLDTVPPVVTGISDKSVLCLKGSFTVSDANPGEVLDNGQALSMQGGEYLLNPGTHALQISDKAGNTVTLTVTVNAAHTPADDDGDCTTAVLCTVCQEILTPAMEHDFTGDWQQNAQQHWHICKNAGCTVTDTAEDHAGVDDGDCTTAILCKCGYVLKTGEDSHIFTPWAYDGNDSHSRYCLRSGCEVRQVLPCSGTATCVNQAVCTECGRVHGEIDPDNHASLQFVKEKKPTYYRTGNIEYWRCNACGKLFRDEACTQEIGEADTVLAKLVRKSDSPSTGDTMDPMLLIAVMCLSAGVGGILITTRILRKRREN